MPLSSNNSVHIPQLVPVDEPLRITLSVAALYSGWLLLAWLSTAFGHSSLPPGAGLLLAGGVLASNLVLLFLSRGQASQADEHSATLITLHGIMGMLWASLYGHFGTGNAALFAGMLLSALALPLLLGVGQAGRHLSLLALLALAGVLGLKLGSGTELTAAAGALHFAVSIFIGAGLLMIGAHLQSQRQHFRESRDHLVHALREARRRSERDELTPSYSRRHIMEMLVREKGRAERAGEPFSICLLDIDHFKAVNDRYGHLTGDRILTTFVRRVRRELRSMDSMNSDSLPRALGRFGGEEFLVILPGARLQGALRCAERLRQAIVRRPFNGLHHVTTSIGIAEYQSGESIEQLLRRCDEALYAAKRAGRNRVNCSTGPGQPNTIVMPDLRQRS